MNRWLQIVLALALGVGNAILLFGTGPIDPTNLDWLFGDGATYYVGWASFRHDPHLHFPLAWTERIGYPVGASIAWLDAIPLAALMLRPFSPILPEPFQYLGLYSAACFVLQAYVGLRLCNRLFPSQPAFAAIASIFFLLSAPLTWRAFGHTALLSHWLILAALDGYFRDTDAGTLRFLGPLWIVLGVSAGITPYLAVMSLFIALAGVTRLALERRCRWPAVAMLSAATVGVLVASWAIIGVLASGDASAYWASGYGRLSLNLNSVVNPMEYGSVLLPALPVIDPGQAEGYNYLGLGVLGLLGVNLIRSPKALRSLADRRLLPLVALGIGCSLLAISTTVSMGSRTLFEIPLPAWAVGPLHGLRASGRLFWPAYYLIVLAALALTFHSWKPAHRVAILAIALGIQVADLLPLRTHVRSFVDRRYPNPLHSPRWNELGARYDNLILVPPYQCGPAGSAGGVYGYVYFGKLAAERMRSNSYYAARYTRAELYAHCVDVLRAQLAGQLDANSAYVATDAVRTVWTLAGMRSHRCDRVEDYNLCTPVPPSDAAPVVEPPTAAVYTIGDTLDFSSEGNAREHMTFGWGEQSPSGAWTQGPMALLRLGLGAATDYSRALVLEADLSAFVLRGHRRVEADVVINGQPVDHWIVRSATGLRRTSRIPAPVAAARRGLDIEFRIRNPEAPLYVGAGSSSGFRGLHVHKVVVRYE